MPKTSRFRRTVRATTLCVALAVPLSGCISLFDSPDQFVKGAQRAPATVNPAAAAAAISEYRRSRGLSAVTVDGKLTAIARGHSQAMAKADKMAHHVRGEPRFEQRLRAGGYDASVAAENVAAGHRNFNEAFAGWKASPGHRANMLKPGVTQIGIAVAYSTSGKYGNFWTLVLAAPDNRSVASGPNAGPLVAVPR